MSKIVYVFLAEGFEEIEALTTIDLLRRADLTTITVAVGDSLEVRGAHHVPVIADIPLAKVGDIAGDAFVLPGGLPGVTNLANSPTLLKVIKQGYEAGKVIGAICAAPSILGGLGILEGREATCYPSFEPQLTGYVPTDKKVVVSGRIVTARSAGVSQEFALSLIELLTDKATADSVHAAITP